MAATQVARQVAVRNARPADVPLVLSLVRELAEYEGLAHEVTATEESLRGALFGECPAAEVLIGCLDGEAVGFVLFFPNFSTFLGRPGIYIEDLYVQSEARGHGVGRALLGQVAGLARERGCGRLEWAVLDWNEPAIGFYQSLGAAAMHDWTVFRVTGEALDRLAELGGA